VPNENYYHSAGTTNRTFLVGLFEMCNLLVLHHNVDLVVTVVIIVSVPLFMIFTTHTMVSSIQLWIWSACAMYSPPPARPTFLALTFLYGFLIVEMETRRIAHFEKWTRFKERNWLRGGCLTNCWLKMCCGGCFEDNIKCGA